VVVSTDERSILWRVRARGMLHGMNVVSAEGIADKGLRRVTEASSED